MAIGAQEGGGEATQVVVRRRRREPALLAPISGGANGSGIGKPLPSITVKRSSRFRGVSRAVVSQEESPSTVGLPAPAEHQLLQAEAHMLPHGNPFLLDHHINAAAPASSGGGGQEASLMSPCGGVRKRGSPTALGLLLKSSMFRQLVEKNSDAEEAGQGIREAAAAAVAHPEAYEYHNFFQGEDPDMCDLFSSGGGHHARDGGFQGEIACYDDGERLGNWSGFGNMSNLQ
ncbi:hypothetical protein HU200_026628 [Digitaria exilis]|uniref:Uncharacterized protein n=1 Tax=Digitaria exilis TaxID=1010633 RepID=A0A835EU02_9POAL|nr:hypothetical protein HU200_026628 [Digitaria exilis]